MRKDKETEIHGGRDQWSICLEVNNGVTSVTIPPHKCRQYIEKNLWFEPGKHPHKEKVEIISHLHPSYGWNRKNHTYVIAS